MRDCAGIREHRVARAVLIAIGTFIATVVMFTSTAHAALVSANIYPNADKSVPAGVTGSSGSCSAANTKWNCLAFANPDSDYVSTATAQTGTMELGTTPITAPVSAISAVMYAASSSTSCIISYSIKTSSGTVVASSTVSATNGGVGSGRFPILSMPHTIRVGTATASSLSLDQATVDGLYLQFTTMSSCTQEIWAVDVKISWTDPAPFSGTVDNTGICDGSTPVVGIAKNAALVATVPCAPGTGAFSGDFNFAQGDTITAYYNGVGGGMANAGATWVRADDTDGHSITNVQVIRRHYRTMSRGVWNVSNIRISLYSNAQDPDIYLTSAADQSLTVTDPSAVFEVVTNTFTMTAGLSAPSIWIHSGAVVNAQSFPITITGSGTGTCSDAAESQPFCDAGTLTAGTGSVTFTGSTDSIVPGDTYYDLAVAAPAGSSANYQLGATGKTAFTIQHDMTLTGASDAPITSTSAMSPSVTVAGALSVNGSMTLAGSGTGSITVAGNMSGAGFVALTGGSVVLRNAGIAQQLDPQSPPSGSPWQFATLELSTSSTARTVTLTGTGSRGIAVGTLLQVGRATDTATTTFDASASTAVVDVQGNLTITSHGSLIAPPQLHIGGDLTSTGTFTNSSGDVNFDGSTSTVSVIAGNNFYNFTVNTGGTTVQLATNITVTHQLTLSGPSCITPVSMRSSSAGTSRTITDTGAITAMSLASLQDMSFQTTPVTASNSADLGGNTNVSFTTPSCGTLDRFYADSQNAATGTFEPTAINGRGAFHLSFRNMTGATVDHYRTQVSSSLLDSSVLALYPLDGDGTDRANANTLTGAIPATTPTWPTGATNFGQDAHFDGVDDELHAPSNARYDTSVFTVELWMRASSWGSDATPILATRALAGNATSQFRIWLDSASRTLNATATTGGSAYTSSTPGAPWLDNTWHHIAMTLDGSRAIRLYVDGTQYGTAATLPTAVDLPSAQLSVGGNGSGTHFAGDIDDVQMRNVAATSGELHGYAATLRPHAQSIWQSAGYAGAGAALAGNCLAGNQCSDIAYGGTDIHHEGARYYVQQQARTSAGFWSSASTDWFETADAITVTAPGSITLPPTSANTDATTNASITTTCASATGCDLSLYGASDAVALGSPTTTTPVAPFPSAPAPWAAGVPGGLGFTVLSSTSGKDTTRWGTGADFSNLAALNFAGARRTPVLLKHMSAGSETTVLGARLDVDGTTVPGSYSGAINIIAVAT